MRTNVQPRFTEKTHGGAPAARMNTEQALRRSVLSCLLWEREFYEEGEDIAARILRLASEVDVAKLAALTIEARENFNLRHVPLLLLRALIERGGPVVGPTIERTIQRADELSELLAIYWKGGKRPLSKQMKVGLAGALRKFDEYQLAKYDRAGAVRLRDVLFLTHAKPKDAEQAALWARLAANELAAPDTWEVALSGGANKKETFERLIREGGLGYLALLRNLRNMADAGCDEGLIRDAIVARKNGAHRVLPFRFFAAAREAPRFEASLDEALVAGFSQSPKLAGKTIIVLDVSGSMQNAMSGKSRMTRLDAGASLAAVARGLCDSPVVYATAGSDARRTHATKAVPARNGMALRDALVATLHELGGGGIFLKPMLEFIREREGTAERIIVITDEQDCAVDTRDSPTLAAPFGTVGNYLINVASAKNGVGYGRWTHVDGMSEATIRFIGEHERTGT